MKNTLPISVRRVGIAALLVAAPVVLMPACTDLTEIPEDALTPDNGFKNDEEILSGLASVYARLRSTMWGYFNLSEVTTDEVIVPTRGSDWYDNGRWLEIYKQTWTANSGSALDDMNGTWNDLNSGVARANLMISIVEDAGGPNATPFLAELRALRAWYYYMLMDMFGGVPVVTGTELQQVARASRDSVFRFIESELKAVRLTLPPTRPGSEYGRVTRGAADAILANMYQNARVFTGTVTPTGLVPGAARWQEAENFADSVINSGRYSLATDFKRNFAADNEGSPENIFVIVHSQVAGLGMSLAHRTGHYNHFSTGNGGPWNGFAAIAETYRAFDPADVRRGIFLVGPQVSLASGVPITDRANRPLVITDTIGDATQANEDEGPRYNKFPPTPNVPNGDSHPNDYPFFRLADMYLIKAEALNELGQTGAAITEINRVRARSFSPPKPIATGLSQAQVRDAVLQERLFEFAFEGKRRQDLIRHGKYTSARRFKLVSEGYRILMPIPATQIQANPLLTQNPGY
jgi:hypothetical protein